MFGFKNPGFANIMAGISAGARDLGHPGQNNLAGVLQGMDAEKLRLGEEEKKRAQQEALMQTLTQLQGNPNATRQDWLAAFGPQLAQQGNVSGLLGLAPDEVKPPGFVQGPGGWWKTEAGKDPVLAVPVEKEQKIEGGEYTMRDPVTGAVSLRPGAADALRQLTETRAGTQAQFRAKPRGRSGGGGGARPHSVPLAGRVIGPSLPSDY